MIIFFHIQGSLAKHTRRTLRYRSTPTRNIDYALGNTTGDRFPVRHGNHDVHSEPL